VSCVPAHLQGREHQHNDWLRTCRQSLQSQRGGTERQEFDSAVHWNRTAESGELTGGSSVYSDGDSASAFEDSPDAPLPDANVTGWAVQSGLDSARSVHGPAQREKLLAYIGIFVRSLILVAFQCSILVHSSTMASQL
jgi:hypothetical protein